MTRISVSAYFTTIISRLNNKLRQLCEETNTFFLYQVYNAVENPEKPLTLIPEITRDGAHFNFQGYEVLGKAIVGALDGVVKPGSRVMLIGDSITAGYPEYEPLLLGKNYGDEKHSFGYYIRTMLECEVVNCGISGDLTSSMATRISEHLKCEPDYVIMQGGANDAYYSIETRTGGVTGERAAIIADTIFKDFRSMVEECRDRGVPRGIIPLLPFYDSALDTLL